MKPQAICALALLTFASIFTQPVSGADYPERNITVVVPFPPGGASDVTARLTSNKLSERIGKSVIIENRAGANGSIGAAGVKSAAADGYTLLIGSIGVYRSGHYRSGRLLLAGSGGAQGAARGCARQT